MGCAPSAPTPVASGVKAGLCYAPNHASLPCDRKYTTVNSTKIMPGGMLSLSANGNLAHSAVLWTTLPLQTHELDDRQDRVFAFDGETLRLLWYTSIPKLAKFVPPTVADGKVFIPTQVNCLDGLPGCPIQSELRIYQLAGVDEAREGYGTRDSCKLVNFDGTALCAEAVQIATHGSDRILTTDLGRATSRGFAVESVNAFHVMREAHAGAALLYECYDTAHDRHIYTRDVNCGSLGAQSRTGAVGRVAVTQVAGTIPLYSLIRLDRRGIVTDYLYLTSASAIATAESQGFINMGAVGYVGRCLAADPSRLRNLDHYYTSNVEWALDYPYRFYLHSVTAPGVVPFYECLNAGGTHHFYTGSNDCEGLGTAAQTMEIGTIAAQQLPGTVPLYRWNIPSLSSHYYTTSPATPPGPAGFYVAEGIAGYVWTSP